MAGTNATTATLAGRLLAQGPAAVSLVDDDAYAVGLDLNPITLSLLPDLARVLHRKHITWHLLLLATLPAGTPEYLEHLDALRRDPDLQAVFLVPLHPGEADRLGEQMAEAAIEPEYCTEGDERYAEADGLCHDHLVASDRAADGS